MCINLINWQQIHLCIILARLGDISDETIDESAHCLCQPSGDRTVKSKEGFDVVIILKFPGQ